MISAAAADGVVAPATMSALWAPSKKVIVFASSVKGAKSGATSVATRPIYDAAYSHKTNGNCAELAAMALVTTKDVKIAGGTISTYGKDKDGNGPKILKPCQASDMGCGCVDYLDHYDVRALY